MIRFVDEPFMAESVTAKLSVIKWKMATGAGLTGLHFITLADNPRDIFDIYPAPVFKQRIFRKSDRVIIGIAGNHNSAVALVEKMIGNCAKNSGSLDDIRGYFDKYIKDHM